jgi:hypothetical protein
MEKNGEMEEQAGVLIVTRRHSARRALASHKMRSHGHTLLYGLPGRAAPCGYCGSLVPTPVMASAPTLRRKSVPFLSISGDTNTMMVTHLDLNPHRTSSTSALLHLYA